MLVYDITNIGSFDQLQYWVKTMNKVDVNFIINLDIYKIYLIDRTSTQYIVYMDVLRIILSRHAFGEARQFGLQFAREEAI